jgi:L-glyceraldehyde 3-phosphate reductase
MNLEYVDIFYSHRPDPDTPMEETMGALASAVQQGKALYVGISSYNPTETREAIRILKELGTPCLIHQPKYSMFDRWVEDGLLDVLEENGVGCIPFSPLAQGLLTDKYLNGIPEGSRAAKSHGFLQKGEITPEVVETIKQLNAIAQSRGQSLAQMAVAWLMKDKRITSVLVGVSSIKQLEANIGAIQNIAFSNEELQQIEKLLNK